MASSKTTPSSRLSPCDVGAAHLLFPGRRLMALRPAHMLILIIFPCFVAVFSPYFQSFPPEMRNRKRKSFPREMRMCERHTDMEKQDQNKFLFVSITDQNMNEFADKHQIFWCTNGNKYSCFLMTTFQVTGIRSLTENGRKSDVNKRTWS